MCLTFWVSAVGKPTSQDTRVVIASYLFMKRRKWKRKLLFQSEILKYFYSCLLS